MTALVLVIVAALVALAFAAFNFTTVKKMDEGTDKVSEIAAAIRVGANAFIVYEYKIIETGIKYGTVTVVMDEMPFEITTFAPI